jgi:SAM-dependent methyltransferase
VNTFDLYAAYYDLLYGAKDYAAEAEHVIDLLPSDTRSVLELGCGTGGHALELARRGLDVHGVDISPAMVARARERHAALAPELRSRLRFDEGDVRSHRANRRYDAVLALFHVMSYQTSNTDLLAALRTARAHLDRDGLFVFDFWYGPAVLSDRPHEVIKTVSDERVEVQRTTTPTLHVNENRVDVRFDVRIHAVDDGSERQLHEIHSMRYLFLPELDLLFAQTGFERSAAYAWMSGAAPGDRSWYASVSARAT